MNYGENVKKGIDINMKIIIHSKAYKTILERCKTSH